MPDATRYTEELRRRGEERRRLTTQLAELVGKVADTIADTTPVGTAVRVGGKTYEVVQQRSHLGGKTFLAVALEHHGGREHKVITNREPGSEFYLHGDFHAKVGVADRDNFLFFANHLPEIVRGFEAEEEKAIAALRSAFERLREVALT